tara:strand:+ start:1723 stop:3798 length:2076 start_codon:yes stop_codon:yes gene_type:complete
MMQQILLGFGGSANTGATLYADDLISADLYEGTQNSITITNGIDLSSEGGWVFRVPRNVSGTNYGWTSSDTNNGVQKRFWPIPGTNALATQNDSVTAFNTDGYTFGGNLYENQSGVKHVAHSFRKAPGFFDVITYTGSSDSSQVVSHNLGSAPGAVMIKSNSGSDFAMWHREGDGSNNDGYFYFDKINSQNTAVAFSSTASSITVYSSSFGIDANADGTVYTAFLFAHDDESFGENSNESIVYCGHFEKGSSGSSVHKVTLPWEPGIVYAKCTDQSSGEQAYWYILDYMRGFSVYHHANIHTNTHSSGFRNEENKNYVGWYPQSDGFVLDTSNNGSYQNMVGTTSFIAFRRPGHRPPTSAADVFKVYAQTTGTAAEGDINYGFSPDLVLFKKYNSNSNNNLPIWVDRMRGRDMRLDSTSTSKQYQDSGALEFDRQDGISINSDASNLYSGSFSYRHYAWKRAAKFFDIVVWDGTSGGTQNVAHNLQVAPEMVITKMADYSSNYGGDQWYVYHKNLGTDTGGSSDNYNSVLGLNKTDAQTSSSGAGIFGSAPTATNLPFDNPSYDSLAVTGDTNAKYVAYLFASVDGVSKVGYYTGQSSGSYVADTLGFTPKFIMIKAADRTGDWNVFDVERGLTVGGTSAVAVALNNTNNETQTGETDAIRATTNGFTVNTGSASTDINENGKKYIYYAVA